MNRRINILFFLFFIFSVSGNFLNSQNPKIDSLLNALKSAKEDSNKVNVLNNLCNEYRIKGETDIALEYGKQAHKLAEGLKWDSGIAKSLSVLGAVFVTKGEYGSALDYFSRALELENNLGEKTEALRSYGNIGVVYKNLGDYSKALSFYFKALSAAELLNDKNISSTVLGNIGNIYKEQNQFDHALDYYEKALAISEAIGDNNATARHLGNMGTVYISKQQYSNALNCFEKALSMSETLGYKQLQANTFGNIGNAYSAKADSALLHKNTALADLNYNLALGFYRQSFDISEKAGNQHDMAAQLLNISDIYVYQKKFKDAEEGFLKALALAQKINALNIQKSVYEKLSGAYSEEGKDELAFEYLKKYIAAKDSISNEENTKKQTRTEMQYDFDKKTAADSIKNSERKKRDDLKHEQEIKQQKIYAYGGIIGFLLMLIVAVVSFRAYRNKQRANEIISQQKLLVEEKQKEILDSIHYAKRIQQSLMPTENYIGKNLKRLMDK